MKKTVKAWRDPVVIPTYEPAAPDKNPMFLEKRVYQGSSGRVYPLPFYDRINETKTDRAWQAVHLENEYVRLMILPEIGGRIHIGQDKGNGYDFFYRQNVIKPALVGLAGPWLSGGVEFNWPQHHRPATFMPVDTRIENHADGSVTVWCSDHDPMARMKGMHGVCLHPGKSVIELKVRVHNRTPYVQTFLWWANVATRVHGQYQSFFPPDVYYVADHAKRAMSEYPLCKGHYYGVDYAARAAGTKTEPRPNDLSWYANIPVPTSYMCMGTQEDFFGGYDHAARGGVVHVANHHISPGKKQWTWGNHPFGYAWDRNLTDTDGPYIELMAGVYTDNQPDFSFLMPGETKTWSQYWYPIREIGPAQHANLDAAVSLQTKGATARIGIAASSVIPQARIQLEFRRAATRRVLKTFRRTLSPDAPLVEQVPLPRGVKQTDLRLIVLGTDGREILAWQPKPRAKSAVPPPATEPPAPADIASADELYITGLHLEQYRHATRCPTLYWREALRRDSGDARCNNAMGLWHLRRGEFKEAERFCRAAIERITARNPNPYDGEAYYNLGLCLRLQADSAGKDAGAPLIAAAYAAFYKATWNMAWQASAYHGLAELDGRRGDWATALDHLDRSLKMNADNLRARNLKSIALTKLGRTKEAAALLRETQALDPLDPWAHWLSRSKNFAPDAQTCLDLAIDCARAGLLAEAVELLSIKHASVDSRNWGTEPMRLYHLAQLHDRLGNAAKAKALRRQAHDAVPDYCFPARLEDIAALECAIAADPRDARAPYYLGNLLYDRRRHAEAIRLWQKAASRDPSFSIVWRNLGIGYFNITRKPRWARAAYDKALRVNPKDARLLFERDQLWKRIGEQPAKRLAALEQRMDLVRRRDDLCVELCSLWNQTGEHAKSAQLLAGRKFQPWEGGEGQALGQHVRTQLCLGRIAFRIGDLSAAVKHFTDALTSPENLGEAKHLLQNQSDIHYHLGCAYAAFHQAARARQHWIIAAAFKGDFQEMSVRRFSEMTYYSALALAKLGRRAASQRLLRDLLAYAQRLEQTPAKIDYFATSLAALLLFDDDLQARQTLAAHFMQAQARLGLGQRAQGRALLKRILRHDPAHALAADLLNELA